MFCNGLVHTGRYSSETLACCRLKSEFVTESTWLRQGKHTFQLVTHRLPSATTRYEWAHYGPCIRALYSGLLKFGILFLRKYNKISCFCYSAADDHDHSGTTGMGELDDSDATETGDIDATG